MATLLQGEQLTPTFAKYSTVGGVAGSLRLVSTGEATNILPLAVVLQTAAGVSYTASGGGGGGGEVTIGDPTTATNQAAVQAPGTSGAYALAMQGVTGGTPVNVAITSGGGGSSNTVAPTAPGTSATTANPVQGVTGGVPLPVSGTFYQTTQPVSIAASVAVTGTFYQTTQPVSIAASVAVTGTFYQATQPVSLASLPALATGTNTIGAVTPLVAAAAVSATNPMPTTSGQFARTDKSGTITAGNTAQTLFAAGAITHGGYFQNLSTVAMYLRDDGTTASAGQGSVLIPANGGFWYWDVTGVPPTSASIFCATTGSVFTCKVW
jgi:hypothetical protein